MSIFYFDIDNTITKTPLVGEELTAGMTAYQAAEPIMERIEEINQLYDKGHHIVYWTGRGTVSGIHYGELTEKQLESWGAKHHELKFGKPNFDYLIDDKASSPDEWFRPLKVGIVINNMVRDYIKKLIELYVKYTTPKDATEPHLPIFPINPYKLEDSFPLDAEDSFKNVYEWIYYGVALEVFGGAHQTYTNLLQRIGLFQTKIHDEIILMSRETSRTKMATLSFLSKNQFDLKQIIFVDSYEDYWKHVDIVVTDNPEILKAKPAGKVAVVLKNEYNTDCHSLGYAIDKPSDMFMLPFFHRKPITPEELIHITNDIPEGEEEDKLEVAAQTQVEGAKSVSLEEAIKEVGEGNAVLLNLTELRDQRSEDDKPIESDTGERID